MLLLALSFIAMSGAHITGLPSVGAHENVNHLLPPLAFDQVVSGRQESVAVQLREIIQNNRKNLQSTYSKLLCFVVGRIYLSVVIVIVALTWKSTIRQHQPWQLLGHAQF